jgi:anthranilate phosphoribosyltransferase
VVSSEDGLDEVSLSAGTRVARLEKGTLHVERLTPEDFGLARAPRESLAGGDAEANARIIEAILAGEDRGPRFQVVQLNAAAALRIAGKAADYGSAAALAKSLIDRGEAREVLEKARRPL